MQLNLDSLKGKTSIAEVKSTLQKLMNRKHKEPGQDGLQTALRQAYDEALERIDQQSPDQKGLARNALEWITCAKRPLTRLELRHALSVKSGDTVFDPDNFRDVDSIISVCAGLVTIDKESNIVRLVHYTAQEYFDSRKEQLFPDAETKMSVFCCEYLSNISRSGDSRDRSSEDFLQSNPLYNYAGQNWGHHARLVPEIPQTVRDFMTCPTTIEAAAEALDNGRKEWNGLHLAAFFGICKAIDFLPRKRQTAISRYPWSWTPLKLAVHNRDQDMVRLLVEKGAATPTDYSAVCSAVENDDEPMVRLLLELRANVNPPGSKRRTSFRSVSRSEDFEAASAISDELYLAALRKEENIVRLLLDKWGDVIPHLLRSIMHAQTPDRFDREAQRVQNLRRVLRVAFRQGISTKAGQRDRQRLFFLAARFGSVDDVQLLLLQGVAVQSSDDLGDTALAYAAIGGNTAIVRLLLEKGAAVDARNENGHTPLLHAAVSIEDCTAVIELLLDRGADIDARDGDRNTPLLRACAALESLFLPVLAPPMFHEHDELVDMSRRYQTVQLLLDRGAAIEASNRWGRTALMEACNTPCVRLLLNRGAVIETRDDGGRTALMLAVRQRRENIVKELLSRGAAVHARDNKGRTALLFISPYIPSKSRAYRILRRFIDSGASIDERNNSGRSLLMEAAKNGLIDISSINALLCLGADIEARDNEGRTALMYAARYYRHGALRKLLDGGAALEAKDSLGKTALMHAAQRYGSDVLLELLDRNVAIEARDELGQTALLHAARQGKPSSLEVLLDKGADIEAGDHLGQTALMHAASNTEEGAAAVRQLLKAGAALDAKDKKGRTALSYAIRHRKRSVVVELLRGKWQSGL